MRLSAAARFRMMAVASLVAMLAAVGFLVIDRDGSTVQAATFGFSAASAPAINVDVGTSPDYTAPNLEGMGSDNGQCFTASLSLTASDGQLNGLHVNGYKTGLNTPGVIKANLNNVKIKGKPKSSAAQKTYTVTATCDRKLDNQNTTLDSVSYTIQITAVTVPMAFSNASLGNIKLVKGHELLTGNDQINNPIGPDLKGEFTTPVAYSISPTTLPTGLSFSNATGKITGTPTAVKAAESYTVTATDSRTTPSARTADYTVDIEVVEPLAFPAPVVRHTLYQDDTHADLVIAQPTNERGTVALESPEKHGGTTASLANIGLQYSGSPPKSEKFEWLSHGDEYLGTYQYTVTAKETYRGHVRQTATVRYVFTMKPPKEFRFLTTYLGLKVVDQDTTVTTISPPASEWSHGAVTYAISPALPSGMTFDTATGAVGGTAPSNDVKRTRHTVTATDSQTPTNQTASYSFDLLVKHPTNMSFVPNSLGTIDVEVNEEVHYTFQPHTPLLVNVADGCTPVPILQEWVNGKLVNAGVRTTGTIRMVPSTTKTPPENYERYFIEGKIPASKVNQTFHYVFELNCNHGDAKEVLTYSFALRAIPQKMKFKPADRGYHVLYKDVAYTFLPPKLVAASGTVTYANASGRNIPGGTVNPSTGVISGTPTFADQRRKYTITASDSSDPPQTATFTIDLSVSEAMTFASESLADQTLTVGTAMTSLNPPTLSNSDGVVRYTVSPNIPNGLAVSNANGVISGTPTAPQTQTTYTITATDSTSPTPQTDTFTVNIKVNPATAMAFSGTKPNQVLAAGTAANITALATLNSVGTLTYSISPALPTGLSMSTTTGAITGTPTAASASTPYTIAVTDSNGQSANYSFNIEVVKPTVSFSAATSSPTESAGTVNVAVGLSPAPATDITVRYTVSGSATSGSDYTTLTGSVSVSSGTASVNIPVTITDDSVDDDDETIILTLSAGGNFYTLGSTSVHTATITDNDDPPAVPVLTIAGGSAVTEGTAASFTVSATPNVSGPVTLGYTVAQTGDFVAAGDIGTTSVSFTGGTGTITVATVGDSADEANGSVTVTLNAGTGYTLGTTKTATVNVNDDDVPELTITAGSTVTEGTDASFTVSASPSAASAITVKYTVTQSGAFVASNNLNVKTVSLSGGTATFTVPTVSDSTDEADGSVTVTLNAGSGYTLGSTKTATVDVNDDDATVVSLARTDSGNIAEGGTSAKANAEFTVTLGRQLVAGETIEVPLVLSGTGVTADDVNVAKKSGATINKGVAVGRGGSLTPTVTFTGHGTDTVQAATLLLTSPTDSDTDSAETITVALGPDDTSTIGFEHSGRATNVSGGADRHSTNNSFNVSVDAETAPTPVVPTVKFSAATSSAVESAGTHNVGLTLSASQSGNLAVGFSVTGTATSGSDYTGFGTTISFLAGTTTVNIAVPILDDSSDEANETVIITLTDGTAYDLGTTKVHTLTITDNDNPPPATPVVSISAGNAVAEGTDASFSVTASPAPGSAVILNYTVTQSGSFVATSNLNAQSVSLSGGSGTITVPTVNDSADEVNGSVTVTLNSGSGYSVHNTNGADTVTVSDNDVTQASFATATSSAAEGSGTKTVRVNLSPAPATALTLNYTVSGTATSGSDYTSIGTSVSVPSGSSFINISVPILNDSADEVDETVIITLGPGSHYTINSAANVHTSTITDNDVPAVFFGAAASSIGEGGGTKNITVDISPPPATGFTLSYAVSGTATSGSDYTSPSGTVGVAQGQTRVTIPVAVTDDSVTSEGSETVILTLSNGSGYELGSRTVHTLSISDNDGTPTASFNTSSATIMEGPNKTQSVRINFSPAPSSQITLRYGVSGTATSGSDYNTLSGSKTVTAGSISTTVTIYIIDDSIEDTGETVVLTLSSGTDYAVGSPSTFTLTITNDDRPGTGSTPARAQRKAYIPSDPPNFCRGAVSEVADPPQQPFPTLGREVAPQRPCRGSGTLTLHDLADTLDDDQTKREQGFYITAQLHSTSDYRSRFRGGSGSKLYVVDSTTEARYQLLGGARRMIELSLWLIVENPIQDSNTVARLGREAGLSEEFSICLPYEPTKRHPVADIARWDPSTLSWDILDLTLTESDDQVCALTDQVSSFVLVTPEPKPSAGAGIPQPGDPQ